MIRMTLVMGLIGAVVALGVRWESDASVARATELTVISDQDFLGKSPAEVFKKYGVPLSVDCTPTVMSWNYLPLAEGKTTPNFLFHENVVVSVDFLPKKFPKIKGAPVKGAYLGQSAIELGARLGSPLGLLRGQFYSWLRYEGGLEISLAHGFVTAIRKN